MRRLYKPQNVQVFLLFTCFVYLSFRSLTLPSCSQIHSIEIFYISTLYIPFVFFLHSFCK